MPISIACQCGKKLTVKDELAGKRVRCPGCQAILSVAASAPAAKPKATLGAPHKNGAVAAKPAAPAPVRAAPPVDEEEEEQEHEQPARKSGRTVPQEDDEDEEQSQQHGEEENQSEDDRPRKKRHTDEEDQEEESPGGEDEDEEPVVTKKPSRKVETDEEEEEEQQEEEQEEEPVARKKPGRKFEPDEEEDEEPQEKEEEEQQDEDEEPVVKKRSSRKAQVEEEEEEEEERPRGKKGSKKAVKADEEEKEEERPKKGKSKGKGKVKLEAPPPMLNFNKFIVKAKAKGGKKTFAIQDAESGDVIATAKNATGFLSSLVGSVVYGVMDGTTDELAFTVGRTGWPLKKDQIMDGKGRVVARFKSKFLSLSGGFHVYDEEGKHICEIKGKLLKSEYKFLTPDGDEMGSVSKTWGGAFKSLMTGAGTYGVQVEDEYADDARIKMIMLAATIAVETIFQKPKSGKSAGADDSGGDDEE